VLAEWASENPQISKEDATGEEFRAFGAQAGRSSERFGFCNAGGRRLDLR
jgi:hypothetical protein